MSKQNIWQLVLDINKSWINGNLKNLANFFHKDMVIYSSEFEKKGEGRENCVKSYEDFTIIAKILDFKESNQNIDLYNNTAVVSYRFEMSYQMDDKTFNDRGRDMFVFTYEGGKWLAIWRMVFSLPEN
ncbi:MAG: nuclear transport factor 2 family protein [Candidatus Hermodarchaeota archaeon]